MVASEHTLWLRTPSSCALPPPTSSKQPPLCFLPSTTGGSTVWSSVASQRDWSWFKPCRFAALRARLSASQNSGRETRCLFLLEPSGWKLSQALSGVLLLWIVLATVDWALKYAKWVCPELQAFSAVYPEFTPNLWVSITIPILHIVKLRLSKARTPAESGRPRNSTQDSSSRVSDSSAQFLPTQHCLLPRTKGTACRGNTYRRGKRQRKTIKTSTKHHPKVMLFRCRPRLLALSPSHLE